MRLFRIIGIIIFSQLVLTGCTTMSEAECGAANWELRGDDDAMHGKRRDYVNEHTKACAKFDVTPNLVDYRRGWDRGAEEYCTRSNGWNVGISGASYHHTCPADLEAEFYGAYRIAVNIHRKKSAVSDIETELQEIKQKLNEDDIDEEKREKLKKKRRRLRNDLVEAKADSKIAVMEAHYQGFPINYP
jgi:hypothetical protein